MYGYGAQGHLIQIQNFVRWAFLLAIFLKYFGRKNFKVEMNVIEKWYIRWFSLLTMLFSGRIYIAQGLWYFGDFCNIFLPKIAKQQKKSYQFSLGPWQWATW